MQPARRRAKKKENNLGLPRPPGRKKSSFFGLLGLLEHVPRPPSSFGFVDFPLRLLAELQIFLEDAVRLARVSTQTIGSLLSNTSSVLFSLFVLRLLPSLNWLFYTLFFVEDEVLIRAALVTLKVSFFLVTFLSVQTTEIVLQCVHHQLLHVAVQCLPMVCAQHGIHSRGTNRVNLRLDNVQV